MNTVMFLLILFEVILNVIAQLSLKVGMEKIGHFDLTFANVFPTLWQVFTSFWIWFGIAIYVISLIVWFFVLSRIEVSIAYPLTSLGYVLSAVLAYYLLGEHISFLRMLGILIILAGVFVVARS
jgi:multidrug transporter EmrE-like cation transporter